MGRGRTPSSLDLPLPVDFDDSSDGSTKQNLCYFAIRDSIIGGRLSRGLRLPSTRTLALRWRVARGTIELVYDRLAAEGYIERRPGSGSYVCAVIPDSYVQASVSESDELLTSSRRMMDGQKNKSVEKKNFQDRVGVFVGKPFVARLPDPALFPENKWAGYLSRAARSMRNACLSHDPGGEFELRQEVAKYMHRYRQVNCSAEDIFMTTGIRHGLDLVARGLVRQGDKVCIEDPGYLSARRILASLGAKIVDVPVNDNGICFDTLKKHSDAKMVYVTPAHQSPLGVCMPISRRLQILAWARRYGIVVLEDDYDSEYSYSGSPLPALSALDDDGGVVVYCGSFNKTTYSGMRAGFMLARGELRDFLRSMMVWTGRSVSLIEQRALSAYLRDGLFASQLRVMRQSYMQRRDCLLSTLDRYARGFYKVSGHEAGFHCVLWLTHAREECVCKAARDAGISLQPLSLFCQEVTLPPGLVIGYSALDLRAIESNARKLAEIIVSCSSC